MALGEVDDTDHADLFKVIYLFLEKEEMYQEMLKCVYFFSVSFHVSHSFFFVLGTCQMKVHQWFPEGSSHTGRAVQCVCVCVYIPCVNYF